MSLNDLGARPTKQLLIIGNGFDKHLGLKSTYAEYYSSLSDDERKNNIFTYLASDENYNWLDVELLLLKCLTIINKFDQDDVKSYLLSVDSNRKKRILDRIVDYTRSHDFMTKSEEENLTFEILNYLSQIIETNWLLSKKSVSNFKKELMSLMMSQVKTFESNFKEYLLNEIKSFPENIYNVKSQFFIDELLKSGVPFTNEYSNSLLSFNYTPLPNSTKFFNSRGGNNVHGILLDNIILGIDNHNYKEFMEFTKTFRIMTELPQKSLKIYDNSIDIIKFYGHSLGEADYSYFVSIFDTFDVYNSDVVLKFYYDDFDGQCHKKEQVERVYKLINHYGETFDNKDHGQNLLHKLVLERRIYILKVENDFYCG